MTEQIEQIKNKVFKHPKAVSFSMDRVPKDTIDVFKKFANDEFVGDYGMAFKKLVDRMLIEPEPFQQVYILLEDHEKRLAKLEGREPVKFRVRKTLSGREIKIPIKDQIKKEDE